MRKLKHKIDVYFDVDGCAGDQVWFYGTTGFCGLVSFAMMFGLILN